MPTAPFECAPLTQVAGTGPHPERFVATGQEDLSLQGDRNLLDLAARTLKQDRPAVFVEHLPGLFGCR